MPDFSTIQLVYTFLLATTFFTQGLIAAWVYRYQWEQSGAKWFLIMVGTGMVWILPYTFFFVVTNPTYQYIAHGVGFFGAMSTISAFIVFSSKYTEAGFHRNRLIQAHLLAIIGGYLILAPTNNMHHLLFSDFQAVSEPFSYIAVQRGPILWAMVLSIQIPAMYAIYRMATNLVSGQQHAGRQLALFIIGAVSINTLDYIDHLTNLLPMDGFPNATLGMFVFYVFAAVALFWFNLLDVKPVARKTIIENLHDPVLVIEDQNRLIDFNDAAASVWPDLPNHILDPFETACSDLEAAIDTPLEGDFTTKLTIEREGMERHYSVTVSAVTVNGEETGWYSIVLRDITQLEQSRDQLEAQNKRLNKVASTISHDLRNPINVAMGHIDMLEMKLDDDELLEHLIETKRTHGRMLEIIDDILTIAREGETVEETKQIELGALANEAWANVDSKDATLTIASNRTIAADRSKFLTILENLFRNAIDHGPEDASIEIGATESGFYVQDDGPGIPPEKAEDVFEFGFSTGQGGTGLGLSIVRTMVESHGWTIEVDQTFDDGARFRIDGLTPEAELADEEDRQDSSPQEARTW